MSGVLTNRLALVADMQDEAIRERIYAALRIGATLALARISEIGGSYPGGSDFKAVTKELDPFAFPEPTANEALERPMPIPSAADGDASF